MIGRAEPNLSLAGLKTAVRIEAEKIAPLSDRDVADLCAGFQAAVIDMVLDRVRVALQMFKAQFGHPSALVVAGGVAANSALRGGLERMSEHFRVKLVAPPLDLCGDNGAMIAWAGAERLALGLTDPLDTAPRARWPLDEKSALPGARA
jgi:N6-L-threonylcarbamoyladenine synthase